MMRDKKAFENILKEEVMPCDPQTYRFFLMTIDPVHIGTGGMRLGRVDNPIVREPGTRLPKVPGTALHGAIRAYAAQRYGKPLCAGQGKTHCGQPTCPICYTFGAITGERSYAGVVAIGDARILLFPVYSMVGPVWVTSPSVLKDAGVCSDASVASDKGKWGGDGSELPADKPINLGWLMVEKDGDLPPSINWPDRIPEQIRNRVVVVSDKLFSQVVNSNLEVRTSVAINPETGAAEEGALFTYEAIPRATVLWMDVVVDDYREAFPSKEWLEKWDQVFQSNGNGAQVRELLLSWRLLKKEDKQNSQKVKEACKQAQEWLSDEKVHNGNKTLWRWDQQTLKDVEQSVKGLVTAGLEWAQHLGIGGMGTRGFGRIREIACRKVSNDGTLDGSCEEQNESSGE